MHNSTRRLGALIVTLILLTAACGQKGDLYKPEDAPQHGQDQGSLTR